MCQASTCGQVLALARVQVLHSRWTSPEPKNSQSTLGSRSPWPALVSALERVWSSCVALIAFAWTIWWHFFIIHWHPSKWYPRCGLSFDAFMIINEAHYKIFFLLLHIITYYGMIWFTTYVVPNQQEILTIQGMSWGMTLMTASITTITRMGETVGSKSWIDSNTSSEFALWNIWFPSMSTCISNAW